MGTDLPCRSSFCARDQRARQGVLGILYPAQRKRWRSTPCDTTFFAVAVATITGNTASAPGKTDQVSTQNTLAEGTRRSHHVLQWLEFMRGAICPAAPIVIIGASQASPQIFFRRFGYFVAKLKQFRLRLAKRTGLPSEIASALWQKGVHIQAFIVEIEQDEDIFHLAVDKAPLAKQTFVENGWRATEECVQL